MWEDRESREIIGNEKNIPVVYHKQIVRGGTMINLNHLLTIDDK